jgi:hypothetical protein
MQDFDPESFSRGIEHSQKVKTIPLGNDSGSKNYVSRPDPIAVFRFNLSGKMLA